MTIDELQDEARRALGVATATGDDRLYRLAGVVDQLVDFIEGSAFRALSNAGVRDQSKRDREVAHAMFDHLRSLVMYAATAQIPSRGHE